MNMRSRSAVQGIGIVLASGIVTFSAYSQEMRLSREEMATRFGGQMQSPTQITCCEGSTNCAFTYPTNACADRDGEPTCMLNITIQYPGNRYTCSYVDPPVYVTGNYSLCNENGSHTCVEHYECIWVSSTTSCTMGGILGSGQAPDSCANDDRCS